MSLKVVLFDFNGVIIHDEPIHEKLLAQLLLEENLRPKPGEFRQVCLGRNDRACLKDLFAARGRILSEQTLDTLVARKAKAYHAELEALETLPIFPGVRELIFAIQASQLRTAIVSGALHREISLVLDRAQLSQVFPVIVSADGGVASKPEPDSYLLAIDRLNEYDPSLKLRPSECLAIEDTFAGITAARKAGIPVVGVANSYPFHMLQRRANWTVDYLSDLELDRVRAVYDQAAA